jgi:hypothetical protein
VAPHKVKAKKLKIEENQEESLDKIIEHKVMTILNKD